MGAEEFHLRCELRGHDEDVRGVSVCPLGVLTGSRDKTAKLWVEDSPPSEAGTSSAGPSAGTGVGDYSLAQPLVGHTDFVGPVLYAPPSALSDYPQGAIITGSRDKTVRVWDPASASCLAVLEGHEYQVTALGLLPPGGPPGGHAEGGAIVSASLDKTLRVWRGGQCVATLTGHTGPVLCLLVLPGGELLSGSGDTSVKMWAPGGGPCIHTIKAHNDTVRGICAVPGLGFATASHDLSVKVWDSTGNPLAELVGHTAIVYAVAAVEMPHSPAAAAAAAGPGSGGGGVLLASGSEDNTVRIWRPSGECMQVLEHPGNIWAVDFTPLGDLISGCSDAVARVWTARPEARGPPRLREALDNLLAERKAAKEAEAAGEAAGGADAGGGGGGGALPPGLKVEDAFVLSQPGAKDGENKFVRDGATGDVVAYAWDSKSFQWEKLGVVVAGPQGGGGGGGGAKKYWGGREWDFVFDVDIGEGLPPKKLALDRDDNPYLVAQRFIAENELPPYFTEQIVQFILQNMGGGGAKGALAGGEPMDITGGFCDPFTGGSGSGSGSRPPPRPAGGSAPPEAQPASITGGGVDPFTGGGGGGGAGLPSHTPTHIPCHTLLTFDNVPSLEALGRKIREFNAVLSPPQQQLSEADLAAGGPLDSLLQKLPQVAAAAGGSAAAPGGPLLGPVDVALLRRLLTWPPGQLFPALDVARLAALDGAPGGGGELLAAPEAAGDLAAPEPQPGTLAGALASASSSSLPANHQLALRLAANAAASRAAPLRRWLLSGASPLMDRLAPLVASPAATKAVRLSGAVLLGNLAAAVAGRQMPPGSEDVPLQALSCGLELLGACPSPLDEAEGVYRCLVAVGTLLTAGGPELCQIAKDLDINDRIHAVMTGARGGGATEQKLLQVGIDITAVIARSTGVKIQE